jgi:hypothetical protein
MEIIFSNVNIDLISFVNDRHDIKIDFFDSLGLNEYRGSLICKSILSLKLDTQFDCGKEETPYQSFICDVSMEKIENGVDEHFKKLSYAYSSSPESDEYYFVSFDGGEVDIKLICTDIEVIRKVN